ncbi:MAG: GntR family transcriptional regulator [Hydrogenophaga sp.]|nr:GntR family transcriptional regulator [Hydrogenophaga sp.]
MKSPALRRPTSRRPVPRGVAAAPSDQEIHGRLFDALLDQRLAPGTRLREDELGQAFGVSRTRIRQVLIRLASEQLVTLVPNAGARVTEPTPQEAREVFDARRLVEPTLVAGFIERAAPRDLKALQAFIDDEERARAEGQRHLAIRTAGGFHLHIAALAGNATLARMLRELVSRTSLVLMRYGPQDLREPAAPAAAASARGCDCHEHRAIIAAVRLRDAAAGGRLMREHLDRLQGQLIFESPQREAPGLAQLLGL